ncbi:MAG: cobyrinate a,c-diamide synthase [Clostridium sp.]|nr:cobyrinate a,c-diamide synthase [Clostridium sp.]
MKSIVIASDKSGGGKTTVTLGLMKALSKRGFKVQGYKVGPDYIDTAFHGHVTGIPSRNLDTFLMGEIGVKESYNRGFGDFGIVEGVMGLYDGKGITSEYSTSSAAKLLNLPVILALSPKAQSLTLCAQIEGIINFDKSVYIVGIILNNVSEAYYKLLKTVIENYFENRVKVYGYIPKDERISLKSRNLGLVQMSEVLDIDKKIDILSELTEKHVNIDEIINTLKSGIEKKEDFHLKKQNKKIAVARDKAFSFYYRENLELLNEIGDVVYFSPLKDSELPKNIDFLYIGGGYPEVFKEELSSNKSMLKSIKEALLHGTRCYAECGGLMYLTSSIDGYKMVDFFKGSCTMEKRLQNFGYCTVEVTGENILLPKGLTINCHEFHRSIFKTEEFPIYSVKKATYTGEEKVWRGGYVKNNTLAAYEHIHFFSNLDFIKYMVNGR